MIEDVRRLIVDLKLHVVAAGIFVIPKNIADRGGVGITQVELVDRDIAEVPALVELQLLVASLKIKIGVFGHLPFDKWTDEQTLAVTTVAAEPIVAVTLCLVGVLEARCGSEGVADITLWLATR